MRRVQDHESLALDELLDRLVETDLIPSQEPLLDDITGRFAALGKAGVTSVAELRRQLKTSKSLEALAERAEVDADYLNLLRRALGGFFPKPRQLKDFSWLDQVVLSGLNDSGIKNTSQFNHAADQGVGQLEQELGLDDGSLCDVAVLCDLSRVQWVSPKFAGALAAAGYRSADALSTANPSALYEDLVSTNQKFGFYNGTVGRRDINRVIQAARYVHWTTAG